MNRRTALIVAAAILVSVLAIIVGWKYGQTRRAPDEVPVVEVHEEPIAEGPTVPIEIFFPGNDGLLYGELREVPVQEDLVDQMRTVLEALFAGPVSEDLLAALPPEITLGWIHLNEEGVVYVDLKFTGEGVLPAWGSHYEMLAVFSIVNSLFANTPEISSVVLLRDGQQRPTFAGHLDISRPLLANSQLITTR